MQAALYVDGCILSGLKAHGFNFLAQEKAHPYPYAVYTLDDESIAYGDSRNEQAMAQLLRCQQEDDFRPFGLDSEVEFKLSDLR
jgi:hypothetical protein